MVGLFEQLRAYVGFSSVDETALASLLPRVRPSFQSIVELFYARALEHEEAAQALARGEKHVGQLKVTLTKWLEELFTGPWDDAYYERRARIGRVHVQIALPQHFMVSAMNVVRLELRQQLSVLEPNEQSEKGRACREAVQRILDIDLAIMLHTYRQDLEAQNARAERLATFGQLVGSIGHELRNPLGVIETSLYVLKSRPGDAERAAKHLDRIGQQVVLANEIITQLLDLIREKPISARPVHAAEIVADVVNTTKSPAGVVLRIEQLTANTLVLGDAVQIRQVLTNLIDNAVHAASPTGSVIVTMTQGNTGGVELLVDDSGPGVDPSVRNRIFEPLVTTKPKGIGLGLALVRRIVERHQGTIDVSRGPLGGARFAVRFSPADTSAKT